MNKKKSLPAVSSAESVKQHLKELEKADYDKLYYSQEHDFSPEELAKVINEARLNELLAQSDAFLNGLNSEIGDFNESTDD